MRRIVKIKVVSTSAELIETIPEEFPQDEVLQRRLRSGGTAFEWVLEEDQFGQIKGLVSWLEARGLDVELLCAAGFSDEEAQQGALVMPFPGQCKDAALVGPEPLKEEICESCRRPWSDLNGRRTFEIRFESDLRPGFFAVADADMLVASSEFLEALADAGLDSGLSSMEVIISGEPDLGYRALYSEVALGWPAAPHGWLGDGCDSCGCRWPLYAFYHLYERPRQPVHWMSTVQCGRAGLIVTGEVYRWLCGEGARFHNALHPTHSIRGMRMGWTPDDDEIAFLSPEYRPWGDRRQAPRRVEAAR